MSESSTFIGRLKTNFPELIELIEKNDYVILEPKKKLIDKANTTKVFYCNHIYYKSSYDDRLYINLNGKVLKYEHPKFTTYLGWKKNMVLTIKDSSKVLNGIQCFQLDNVCDEVNYTEAKTSVSKSQLQKKKSLEEYRVYNKTLLETNSVYATVFEEKFKKFIKEMKNNYMFMKGYEEGYSKIFNYKKYKLIKKFIELLGNKVENYNENFNIISELVDSLVFDEVTARECDPKFPGLYVYLFENCLVKFYQEEEKKIKKYLKENPSKYDWEGMDVDKVYYSCKFESAIHILENISSKKTVFEKKLVLKEVNDLITEEAKNIFESQEKKNFNLDGNDLLKFWIYVIAHSKVKNILAEAKFVGLFGSGGYDSEDYIAVNFASAVQGIKDEILKIVYTLSQYVESNKISL